MLYGDRRCFEIRNYEFVRLNILIIKHNKITITDMKSFESKRTGKSIKIYLHVVRCIGAYKQFAFRPTVLAIVLRASFHRWKYNFYLENLYILVYTFMTVKIDSGLFWIYWWIQSNKNKNKFLVIDTDGKTRKHIYHGRDNYKAALTSTFSFTTLCRYKF